MPSMTARKFLPLASSVTSVTFVNFEGMLSDTTWQDYPISQKAHYFPFERCT